jgi:predicted glycoside hydrolase/deacetylase ChbG (UPF0249 family)
VNKRLIVTADDFGLTDGVNRAIIRAHREGIVTSASLMVNARAFDSAIALAKENPSLDIGLHLNLTNSPFRFAAKARSMDIDREIRTQIETALGTGLRITHIDGHKHVHVIPNVHMLLRQLAPQYGILALRTMKTRTPRLAELLGRNPSMRKAILKQYGFSVGARIMWRRGARQPLPGPDHFYGVAETGFLDLEAFRNIIQDLPDGTHEMMCHPGYLDHDLSSTPTRLLKQRERELEMLTSRDARSLIQSAGVQLVSYRDIVESYGTDRTDSIFHRCPAL